MSALSEHMLINTTAEWAVSSSSSATSGQLRDQCHHQLDDRAYDEQLYVNLSTFWYCFLAFITTLGLLVSLVSNMIIIYLFTKTPSLRRNPSNIIAVNLSLSDLLYCTQWPSVIYCSLSQSTWMLEINFLCQTFGFLTVSTALASILTVLAMSIERAIVIGYSIHAKGRFTIRGAWLIVVLIWILSICSCLPPLFGKFNRYTLDPSKTSCTLDYLSSKTNYKLYILALYVTYWIAPALIITICYVAIIVAFKRSSASLKLVNQEQPASPPLAPRPPPLLPPTQTTSSSSQPSRDELALISGPPSGGWFDRRRRRVSTANSGGGANGSQPTTTTPRDRAPSGRQFDFKLSRRRLRDSIRSNTRLVESFAWRSHERRIDGNGGDGGHDDDFDGDADKPAAAAAASAEQTRAGIRLEGAATAEVALDRDGASASRWRNSIELRDKKATNPIGTTTDRTTTRIGAGLVAAERHGHAGGRQVSSGPRIATRAATACQDVTRRLAQTVASRANSTRGKQHAAAAEWAPTSAASEQACCCREKPPTEGDNSLKGTRVRQVTAVASEPPARPQPRPGQVRRAPQGASCRIPVDDDNNSSSKNADDAGDNNNDGSAKRRRPHNGAMLRSQTWQELRINANSKTPTSRSRLSNESGANFRRRQGHRQKATSVSLRTASAVSSLMSKASRLSGTDGGACDGQETTGNVNRATTIGSTANSQRGIGALALFSSSCSSSSTRYNPAHSSIASSWQLCRQGLQIRLAKMSFYLILLWFVSWTPIASLAMINSVVKCHHRASALAVFTANTMTKLGPAFDVFIYGISHPKIKSKFKQIIKWMFCWNTRGGGGGGGARLEMLRNVNNVPHRHASRPGGGGGGEAFEIRQNSTRRPGGRVLLD